MAAQATQAVISVGASYVSLGTTTAASGMLISPEGEIEFIAATGQPAATAAGHPLGMQSVPFFFPTLVATQIWAISVTGVAVNVVVTF